MAQGAGRRANNVPRRSRGSATLPCHHARDLRATSRDHDWGQDRGCGDCALRSAAWGQISIFNVCGNFWSHALKRSAAPGVARAIGKVVGARRKAKEAPRRELQLQPLQ
jgi:hypothetical protein